MKKSVFNTLFTITLLICTGQYAIAQDVTSTDAHKVSNDDLKEFIGQFDPPTGQFFSITVSLDGGDRLMAQPTDKRQPNTLMKASTKDTFTLGGTGIVITFNREDDKIVSLSFKQGGQSFTATKVKK